jgi:hypothetical protein
MPYTLYHFPRSQLRACNERVNYWAQTGQVSHVAYCVRAIFESART